MAYDSNKPYKVVSRHDDCRNWSWTERIQGQQSCLIQEKFISSTEGKDPEIVQYFGTSTPHSRDVLLHHLAADQPSLENPVLLVHGASHDANVAWAEGFTKQKGLLYALHTAGRSVFAVTFAHPHGDNMLQAIQLSNVVKRIQELSQSDRLDLVAHSKGGIVALSYLAGMGASFDAAVEGQIEKVILLGTPNRGMDYPFRHLLPNWWVKSTQTSAPLAVDSMLWFGQYINTTPHSIYREGGAFPGLSQLLYRWDDRYPIQLTAQTLYHGGQNWLIHSRGIETAIEEGGNYMEKLLQSPIDRDIELHMLAGGHPLIKGYCTEWDGPSDGLVFVESALYSEGIVRTQDQVKRKTVLPLGHLDLLYHDTAHEWVLEGLVH
ncbi:triacylglycerol lipase [Ammoniphilus sp. CFH 90114]|uniref:esterase/lipase family protein n=1 Tax=Ammoniphilus sp. CFH 90114 TaxID=2493665 RepID=UPI00100EC077|nr:alpha/beta fold hydrolase [Ammoniphilus sp. CFH 90114]RXT04147.1 alpha/beta hydrolase [Ammoniphilus sp. CFH 90114]